MGRAKKLFSFIEVDENTPIQKLSVMDQFRVLVKKITHDDGAELMAEDAVTQSQLQLKADLLGFLDEALQPIREGKRRAVSLSLSNEFDPVLMEVLGSPRIDNYYNVTVTRPDIEFDIKYFIRVDLEVKGR